MPATYILVDPVPPSVAACYRVCLQPTSLLTLCHSPTCVAQIADQLIKEAIQQLDGFDKAKAAPLVALAHFIGYRKN